MELDELRIKIITRFRTQQAFGLATHTDPSAVNKIVNGIRTIPTDSARRWEAALELQVGSLDNLITKRGQSAWIFIDQKKAN